MAHEILCSYCTRTQRQRILVSSRLSVLVHNIDTFVIHVLYSYTTSTLAVYSYKTPVITVCYCTTQLDKVYDEDADEDDMMERYEEMSRMREHVYGEVDTNRDGLISLEEFMISARDKAFQENEAWDVSVTELLKVASQYAFSD